MPATGGTRAWQRHLCSAVKSWELKQKRAGLGVDQHRGTSLVWWAAGSKQAVKCPEVQRAAAGCSLQPAYCSGKSTVALERTLEHLRNQERLLSLRGGC